MDLKQFGEQLRTLRRQAQWSQEELIEALDQLACIGPSSEYRVIDGTLLSRWEHARIQNGRQWKPTRTYTTYLLRLFVPYLDLASAQQWAAQAGYQISPAELQAWFEVPSATQPVPIAPAPENMGKTDNSPAFPHNLPASLTTFVGREVEIGRIITYLVTPTTRLVTLLGEGGVGKTRLALEIAHTLVNERIGPFGDGVYFVSLVGVTTVNAVVSTLADALGFLLADVGDPEQQLLSHLRTRHYLLVLDNFEHLVTSVTPLVTTILQAAPGIHLLATSRIRLNLAEEWTVALEGLPFPATLETLGHSDHYTSPAVGMTEEYGSVQLFMMRARQIDAEFGSEIDPIQRAAIARICGLMQGIPLGIEMAAAWVHMLSCDEIGNQIAQNLDFLISPHRNTPARHDSMRSVFEHSWHLLTGQEQDLLAALAVFQGSFTYEAAANVAEASLLTLRSLVDKSLLNFRAGRYELHELLRQFAEEQLNVTGERYAATTLRHSSYYLDFMAAREVRLAGYEGSQAAAEIASEFNNIRQAWSWAATHVYLDLLESSLYALWRFYFLHGSSNEAAQLFRGAIDQINSAGTTLTHSSLARSLLSRLLTMCAMFVRRQGNKQWSLRFAEEAVAVAEICLEENGTDYQHQVVKAFAHWMLSMVLVEMGEFERSQTILEGVIPLIDGRRQDASVSELARDTEWQLRVGLGNVFLYKDDYPLAREHLEQALATCQSSGNVRGQLSCLGHLGWIELHAGNYAAARHFYEQALPLSRTLGYRTEEAPNLVELGDTVRLQGEYALALQLLERGWSLAHEIKTFWYANRAVELLVYLYCHLGAYQQAWEWLDRWRSLDEGAEDLPGIKHAVFAYHQGAYRQALDVAVQVWQLVKLSGSRSDQARTLVVIGHAQASLQQWADAADAYTEALALYTAMNKPAVALEARAGLAAVALNQSDPEAAMQQVETMLPILAEAPYVGVDEPFYTYCICYRVLTVVQDKRAASVLEKAYPLLEIYADQIGDDSLGRSFWENVAAHRDLAVAYLQSHLKSELSASEIFHDPDSL